MRRGAGSELWWSQTCGRSAALPRRGEGSAARRAFRTPAGLAGAASGAIQPIRRARSEPGVSSQRGPPVVSAQRSQNAERSGRQSVPSGESASLRQWNPFSVVTGHLTRSQRHSPAQRRHPVGAEVFFFLLFFIACVLLCFFFCLCVFLLFVCFSLAVCTCCRCCSLSSRQPCRQLRSFFSRGFYQS